MRCTLSASRSRRLQTTASSFLPALALVAATAGAAETTIAVSVPPLAWLVERLAPGPVDTLVVIAPGQSAETFQPTDAQVSRILAADALLLAGVVAERASWLEAVRAQSTLPIFDTGGRAIEVPERHGNDHEVHSWLSPPALLAHAAATRDALRAVLPGAAATIDENYSELRHELEALDAHLARQLAAQRGRRFYTVHPAWGALADAYGLEQIAVENDGKPPTDAELTRFMRAFRADGATILLTQPQIAPRLAATLAGALPARVESVDPLAADVPATLLRVTGLLTGSTTTPAGSVVLPGAPK